MAGGLKQTLFKIKLNYTTIMHYDPRDSLKHYLGIIDYPFAEVYTEHASSAYQIGDSCSFDGLKDTYFFKFSGKLNWFTVKPNIMDNNIPLLKPFYTIPRYTKKQLAERKKNYPKLKNTAPFYMLIYDKFKNKEERINFHKNTNTKIFKNKKKLINVLNGITYYFYDGVRYKQYYYANSVKKEFDMTNLYIIKFNSKFDELEIREKEKNFFLIEDNNSELENKKPKITKTFYLIQIGSFAQQVNIKDFEKRYKGEKIIIKKVNNSYKYYLTKKFKNKEEAISYIKLLIEKYKLNAKNKPFPKEFVE